MQVNANSSMQMQAYTKLQQHAAPVAQQSAGNKTLQSDTVTFSQEALSASSVERGIPVILPDEKEQ